jgi:hypothetical protein
VPRRGGERHVEGSGELTDGELAPGQTPHHVASRLVRECLKHVGDLPATYNHVVEYVPYPAIVNIYVEYRRPADAEDGSRGGSSGPDFRGGRASADRPFRAASEFPGLCDFAPAFTRGLRSRR